MALGLALFLLATGVLCASAQDVEQFCPGQNPGQVKVVSCTSDTGCLDDEKCCSYSNQKRCVGAVVPNFYASLYFVNLTKTSNDISHLTSFVKDKFRDAGIMVDVKAERLGNCAKASLLMLQTSEGKADQVVTSLTENPVSVSNINGGPFRVTSGLDGDLCPDALPTFSAQIHVFNVTDFVRGSAVKNKIKGLIGNVGSGWEYHFYTIGHCVRVTMQAVLTPQQEVSVTSSLEEAEKEGLKLGDNDVTYNVTANSEEARLCYDDYQQMGCAKGFRMCGDLRKCVPVGRFCDGEDDCGNNADESECNFEEYTVKYVSSFPWQSSLDDKNGYSYQQLASTVKASLEKTFLSMSSFVSATVRDILKTKRSISAVITLTFRGPVDASQVRRREKGFLTYGLDSGFINIVITSVIPASQGECGVKDCGEGLCVETGGQAECRCLPGQELHTCKAIDCRGSENYCGNSSIECVKAGHLSGYTCHCPPGWTGEHCQIDICSQLGSTLCGTNGGRCAGDLYNFTLCACSEDNWGVFCQHRGQAMEMSVCQRHRMLSQSLLQHLQGEGQQNADLLNGYTITDRLQALGIYSLRVPGCETKGYYEHMCVYNSSNVDVNICYCTHPNGTYNGSTYTTDGCQVPNTYDPEERAGTCPPLAEGINSFECRQDGDCPSPQKCCQRGAGRVCKDPYTGARTQGNLWRRMLEAQKKDPGKKLFFQPLESAKSWLQKYLETVLGHQGDVDVKELGPVVDQEMFGNFSDPENNSDAVSIAAQHRLSRHRRMSDNFPDTKQFNYAKRGTDTITKAPNFIRSRRRDSMVITRNGGGRTGMGGGMGGRGGGKEGGMGGGRPGMGGGEKPSGRRALDMGQRRIRRLLRRRKKTRTATTTPRPKVTTSTPPLQTSTTTTIADPMSWHYSTTRKNNATYTSTPGHTSNTSHNNGAPGHSTTTGGHKHQQNNFTTFSPRNGFNVTTTAFSPQHGVTTTVTPVVTYPDRFSEVSVDGTVYTTNSSGSTLSKTSSTSLEGASLFNNLTTSGLGSSRVTTARTKVVYQQHTLNIVTVSSQNGTISTLYLGDLKVTLQVGDPATESTIAELEDSKEEKGEKEEEEEEEDDDESLIMEDPE